MPIRTLGLTLLAAILVTSGLDDSPRKRLAGRFDARATGRTVVDSGGAGSRSRYSPKGELATRPAALSIVQPVSELSNQAALDLDRFGPWKGEIKIHVPAYHGVEPAATISYGSSGGNGVFGFGWRLEGVPVIERKSATLGLAEFNASDRFFMDGAELLACGGALRMSAPSCAAGGNYGFEDETFQKVRLDDSVLWRVWTTAGTEMRLERDPASAGSRVWRWVLSEVRDRNGNRAAYRWAVRGGQSYLHEIEYGYDAAGLVRFLVEIDYEQRPDPTSRATPNGIATTADRVASIGVYSFGQLARAYNFRYDQRIDAAGSFLASVEQLDSNATKLAGGGYSGNKLPAPAFARAEALPGIPPWGDAWSISSAAAAPGAPTGTRAPFTWPVSGSFPMRTRYTWATASADRDGVPDLAVIVKPPVPATGIVNLELLTGRVPYMFSAPGASVSPVNSTPSVSAAAAVFRPDLDGDGLSDFVSVLRQEVTVARGRPNAVLDFKPAVTLAALPVNDQRFLWGDFDGDERSDLLVYSRHSSALQMGGSPSVPCTLTDAWKCDVETDKFTLVRFLADGTLTTETFTAPVGVRFADRFTQMPVPFPYPSWKTTGHDSVLPLPEWAAPDLDGDGVPELVLVKALPESASGATHVKLQLTTHFLTESALGALEVKVGPTATVLNYELINGILDTNASLNLFLDPEDLTGRLLWGEFNGDGREDFLLQRPYVATLPDGKLISALALEEFDSLGDGSFGSGPVVNTLEPASFIGSWRSNVVSFAEDLVLCVNWAPVLCCTGFNCKAENRAFDDGHTLLVGDQDADGIDDLFLAQEATPQTWDTTGTKLTSPIKTKTFLWGPSGIRETRGNLATSLVAEYDVWSQAMKPKVDARFGWLMSDFNADGITDIGLVNFAGTAGATVQVFPSAPRADTPHAVHLVDISGEGIPDLVRVGAYQSEITSVLRTAAQTTAVNTPLAVATGRAAAILTGDFGSAAAARPDGKTDFAWIEPLGGVFPATSVVLTVQYAKGDGTFIASSQTVAGVDFVSGKWMVVDLDGDRLDEIVQADSDDTSTMLRTIRRAGPTAWSGTTTTLGVGRTWLGSATWQPAKVLGGELSDLVRVTPSGRSPGNVMTVEALVQRPSGWQLEVSDIAAGPSPQRRLGKFRLSDFNGDGITDLLRISRTRDRVAGVRVLSQLFGTGIPSQRWAHARFEVTAPAGATVDAEAASGAWRLTDVDGDGFEDAVQIVRGPTGGPSWYYDYVHVLHRTGQGGATWERHGVLGNRRSDTSSWMLADWDADGLSDLVRPVPAAAGATGAEAYPSKYAPPRIARETNGYGLVTDVKYSSSKGQHVDLPVGMNETNVSRIDRLVLPARDRSRIELTYEGFRYDPERRRSFGWEKAGATSVHSTAGAATPRLEVQNAQDQVCPGRRVSELWSDATSSKVSGKSVEYLRTRAHGNFRCLVAAEIERDIFPTTGGEILRRTAYEYDGYGNATVISADGRWLDANSDGVDDFPNDNRRTEIEFDYNTWDYLVAFPRETRRYDAAGALVGQERFSYDGQAVGAPPIRGDATLKESWEDGGSRWIPTAVSYWPNGSARMTTGPTGVWQETTYDAAIGAFPELVCDAKHCTASEWNSRYSALERTIDPNGETTVNHYDAFGRLDRTTFHDGGCLMHFYGDLGIPDKQWSFEGVCSMPNEELRLPSTLGVLTQFDGMMRPWRQSRQGVYERNVTHVGTTKLVRTADRWRSIGGAAVTTSTFYDVKGRAVRVVNPDASERKMGYWPLQTALEDENGNVREAELDAFGALVTAREWLYTNHWAPLQATYEYDAAGRNVRTTDALGNVSTNEFNSLGWLEKTCDPDRGCIEVKYWDDGQPREVTDARNLSQALIYDSLGRLERRETNRNGVNVVLERRWYDVDQSTKAPRGFSLGRVVRTEDESGSEDLTYDVRGRASRHERCTTARGRSVCNEWEVGYDLTGKAGSFTYPDSSGKVSGASERVINDFDAVGRVRRVWSGLGVYLNDAAYDASDAPVRWDFGNGTVETNTWTADRGWLEKRQVSVVSGDGLTLEYRYDGAGRPAQHAWTDAQFHVLDFTYDSLDRLATVTGEIRQSFGYDALGRITWNNLGNYYYGAKPLHGVTRAGPHRLAYDLSGNATSLDNNIFDWDEAGRLVRATTQAGNLAWGYAASGERTFKSSPSGQTFYFDDVVEDGPSGKKYLYSAGSRVIATRNATAVEWLHGDLVASTRAVSDVNGGITQRYDYAPFGEEYRSGAVPATPLKYRAERFDEETGFLLLGSRYYHPRIGRFLSADSIIPDRALPQSLDRYSFVLNSPVRFIDPTGHAPREANAAQANSAKVNQSEMSKPDKPLHEYCPNHPEDLQCRAPGGPLLPIQPTKLKDPALAAQEIHNRQDPESSRRYGAWDAERGMLEAATNVWNLINSGTLVEQIRHEIGEKTGFNAGMRVFTEQDEASRVLSPNELDQQSIEAVEKLSTTVIDAVTVSQAVVGLARGGLAGAARSGGATGEMVKYDPVFALKAGGNPSTVVPDAYSVVRGGTKAMPPPGQAFSGAMGETLGEAGAAVPHGQIRSTTAGAIRKEGGSVVLAPEKTKGGVINWRHTNNTQGADTFGPLMKNPVPEKFRIK